MGDRVPVVVYGATGYTGRLVCSSLATRGVAFAISGRDRAKLDAFSRSLASKPQVIPASIDDSASLRAMAEKARVVLDCAGPFTRLGPPVQDAALAAGSHFLDITGEGDYMRATFHRDEEAKARGIAMVPAVGFDVVPTDCAGVVAAEAAASPVTSLRIAFGNRPAHATQGTIRSLVGQLRHGGLAWSEGKLQPEMIGAERWTVPFPQPIGTRDCISAPIGDVITAPRSTGAHTVRGFYPVPRVFSRWAWIAPLMGRIAGLPGIHALVERWLRSLPEGPTPEQRAAARFAVYAEAVGPKGTFAAWITGLDPYELTAASASLAAQLASKREFAGRGVLTPSQAFGARTLLDGIGVHWGVGTHPEY